MADGGNAGGNIPDEEQTQLEEWATLYRSAQLCLSVDRCFEFLVQLIQFVQCFRAVTIPKLVVDSASWCVQA